jgi:hypothetical protein
LLVFVYAFNTTVTTLVSSVIASSRALNLVAGPIVDSASEPGVIWAYFYGGVGGFPINTPTITVNRTNNATVMYAQAASVTASGFTEVYTPGVITLSEDGVLTAQSVDDGWPGSFSQRYAGVYSGQNNINSVSAATGSGLLNSIDVGNYGAAMVREIGPGQGPRNVGFSSSSDDRAAIHLAIREVNPRRVIVVS